jgi:hypothetical protein
MVSALRLVGLCLSLILLLAGGRRLVSRRATSRVAAFLEVITGAAILIVALDPGVVTPLADLLGLRGESPDRILALLVIATPLAFGLIFFALTRADVVDRRVTDLVRSLALAEAGPVIGTQINRYPVAVCLPAFDEAGSLPTVLAGIPAQVDGNAILLIVVDDGSDDGTAAAAAAGGALVVRHVMRLGGGAALRSGYEVARLVRAQVVVTMDADGQHDPSELPVLVRPILEGSADLVVGSRRLGRQESDSVVRRVGVVAFSALVSALGRQHLTDVSNGFRALRTECVSDLGLRESQFHNAELVVVARHAGLRVVEVPVTVHRRTHGASKKGGNLRYGIGFLRVVIRSWLR